MLYSEDSEVQSLNLGYCADLETEIAGSSFYNGFKTPFFQQIGRNARLSPAGKTPIPFYPPDFTNHQVLILKACLTFPGPISLPVPGYILNAGSLEEDRFYFADESRYYETLHRFVSYMPNPATRDISCALAGLDDRHTSNLGSYTGSVLIIGAGQGYGEYLEDQLEVFGSADKTLLIQPEFGSIDGFMSPQHRAYIERPILRWMRRVFK
jgi:hypothetical protein